MLVLCVSVERRYSKNNALHEILLAAYTPFEANMPSLMQAPNPSCYQHIVVGGTPYERGLAHGTQVAEKVRANIEYYKLPGKLPDW